MSELQKARRRLDRFITFDIVAVILMVAVLAKSIDSIPAAVAVNVFTWVVALGSIAARAKYRRMMENPENF